MSDPHSLCKKRFGVLTKQSFLNHNIHNQEAIHMKKIVIALNSLLIVYVVI